MNMHTAGEGVANTPEDRAAALSGSELPIRFTASGSEYFRIWIVNLLLTLVTFGIYYPWAKVRRLRYFYGNTWVGDHAFDFHGEPRRMLRGTALVGLLFMAYSVANKFSPEAGLVALLIVAGLWPALFRASMRFRLANTSWRGMRFHFNGSMLGAYQALLPVLVAGMMFFGLSTMLARARPEGDTAKATASLPPWVGLAISLTVLVSLALVPLLMWSIKRYQHDHYALGRVQSQLRAGPGSFYALFARAIGVSILTTIALLIVAAIVAFGFGLNVMPQGFGKGGVTGAVMGAILLGMAGYLAVILVNNSYVISRLQNLVWGRTKTSEFRFESRLRLLPLLGLLLKNSLLLLVTFGLYWPFAAVALAKLKLEAVSVVTRRPVEQLSGRVGRAGGGDATGDAAGDVFGLDLGF